MRRVRNNYNAERNERVPSGVRRSDTQRGRGEIGARKLPLLKGIRHRKGEERWRTPKAMRRGGRSNSSCRWLWSTTLVNKGGIYNSADQAARVGCVMSTSSVVGERDENSMAVCVPMGCRCFSNVSVYLTFFSILQKYTRFSIS